MNAAQFIENFLQALTAGLLTGSIYGLMCVGLSVIFGVMRVINFAHGDFMMLGMYAAYYAFGALGAHMPVRPQRCALRLRALLAGPVIFLAGLLVHKFLVSKVTGMRGSALAAEGHYAQLILTLGIALILQNGGLYLFGSTPVSIPTPLPPTLGSSARSTATRSRSSSTRGRRSSARIAVAVVLAFRLLMSTARGSASRCARRPTIPRRRSTWASTWSERTGSPSASAWRSPRSAADCSLPALRSSRMSGSNTSSSCTPVWCWAVWAACRARFFGGLTIGLVQQLSTLLLPNQLQNTAIFVVFLVIILLRPQGLFGRRCGAPEHAGTDLRAAGIADRGIRRARTRCSRRFRRAFLLPAHH